MHDGSFRPRPPCSRRCDCDWAETHSGPAWSHPAERQRKDSRLTRTRIGSEQHCDCYSLVEVWLQPPHLLAVVRTLDRNLLDLLADAQLALGEVGAVTETNRKRQTCSSNELQLFSSWRRSADVQLLWRCSDQQQQVLDGSGFSEPAPTPRSWLELNCWDHRWHHNMCHQPHLLKSSSYSTSSSAETRVQYVWTHSGKNTLQTSLVFIITNSWPLTSDWLLNRHFLLPESSS